MNFSKNKGFTLIELLVVIAIIALLTVFAVVSFNNARTKSRDSSRQADIKSLNNAIQLYIQENNSAPTAGSTDSICKDEETCWTSSSGSGIAQAIQSYVNNLPQDPLTSQTANDGYYYAYVDYTGIVAGCTGGCPNCNVESYQLYLYDLENSSGPVGFNDSECDEWVTP